MVLKLGIDRLGRAESEQLQQEALSIGLGVGLEPQVGVAERSILEHCYLMEELYLVH